MTKSRITISTIVISVLLTACADSTTSNPTTTMAPGSTTTSVTNDTEATTTTQPGVNRVLDVVGCDDAADEVSIVCEVYDLITTRYVDEVDDATLAEAAMEGLAALDGADSRDPIVCAAPTDAFVATCQLAATTADDTEEAAIAMVNGFTGHALDPNSGYLDADALAMLRQEQSGSIEGIGALVSPEDPTIPGENKQCSVVSETCRILVVSTIAGSPAEAAGLQRDDTIVGVGGESLVGWTVEAVTAAVRGPADTDVTLTIERDGDRFDVTLTRASVTIPLVEEDVFADVGYVRLSSFTGSASEQFESAVVDVLAEGASELVIDLRDNPGGFLDTAIDVTSVFLADGDVVKTQGPDETINYPVTGSVIVPEDMQVFFVVNKGSASASEVVSAVLQERGRATVVGENSYGKNTVQQRFPLSNGGALKLTVARWLTPDGADFGGSGVTPDVILDVDNLSDLTPEELLAAIPEL